jgi:hypothetical protein
MPARMVRATTVQNKRFIAIQHDNRAEYHVMLKAARDFNGQFIGYNAWLSKHNSFYLTEDEAVAAMLLAVDGIENLALASVAAPPQPAAQPCSQSTDSSAIGGAGPVRNADPLYRHGN